MCLTRAPRRLASALALAAVLPAIAAADDASTAAGVLDRHLAGFAAHDVEAILADYAADAVFITPEGVLSGKAEIRPLFETLVREFSAPDASVTIHKLHEAGPVAYITWSAETPATHYELATDTLYVEDGLIRYQTFAAKMTPQ